jgi:small-conductance mechanosensitive channel/CRP-like cAMP-binding protein
MRSKARSTIAHRDARARDAPSGFISGRTAIGAGPLRPCALGASTVRARIDRRARREGRARASFAPPRPLRTPSPRAHRGTVEGSVKAPLALFLLALFDESLAHAAADPAAQTGAHATDLVEQLASRWAVVLVGAALVFIAYIVNRFAPEKRKRIRRTAILFGLYLIAYSFTAAFRAAHLALWAERLQLASDLLQAFTVVNLIALVLFDVALPKVSVSLVSITSDLVVGFAYIVTTIGVFHAAGMNLSSVVTTSAVVSGILALSLQATLGNILGGVALQLDGSIHVGDWIQLDNGKTGKVREIHWRHTVVETRDWDTIIVPNAALLAGNITILGKRNGAQVPHRMWVYFNVDFRHSPTRVMEVVKTALCAAPIERVAVDPPPSVICYDFAKDGRDSFAYYAVRYWLTDLAVDDPTSSAVRTRIFTALKRAGIPLARPTSTVFFTPDDDRAARKRLDRHRIQRMAALKNNVLFKDLTDQEIGFLADHLAFAPFVAGETMTKQGAVAHWLYILTHGTVDIRTHLGDGEAKHVATLEAPSFFGEMGLMTGEPRSADVVAMTDAECYRLDKAGFEKIIHDRPEIANEMSKMLARRRVELAAVREGLDAEQKQKREESEAERILERIQEFFGLDRERLSRNIR